MKPESSLYTARQIDLNKKFDSKKKTVQIFNIDTQQFRKSKIENPPTREIGVSS